MAWITLQLLPVTATLIQDTTNMYTIQVYNTSNYNTIFNKSGCETYYRINILTSKFLDLLHRRCFVEQVQNIF